MSTLGRMRLRGENCFVSKEKRRGTVYTRTKTCTRDLFLFEREILLCKKKDEGNGKNVQYQFKELIKVDLILFNHSTPIASLVFRLQILLYAHIRRMIEINSNLFSKIGRTLFK